MRDDFAIFILSHGRADVMKTVGMLGKSGYTGKYYIVCDNEDDTLPEYQKKFGRNRVLVFDKLAMAERMDTGINGGDRKAVCFARNACFDLAEHLGLKYFLEFDDDYTGIEYRFIRPDTPKVLRTWVLKDFLDGICEAFIEFLEKTPTTTIAMAQTGDLLGGAKADFFYFGLARKAMNSFFCSVDRRFWFRGKSNEDVSTYVTLSSQGKLMFTYTKLAVKAGRTQSLKGGMTEFYESGGGYIKPFSSVIFAPNCIKIATMGPSHRRLHHRIDWNACAPKILSEKWKKK